MPRMIVVALVILGSLLLVPPALVLRARYSKSRHPRIHIIPDMDNQQKFKAQSELGMFLDGRAARPRIEGTISREQVVGNPHFTTGRVSDEWVTTMPVTDDFRVNDEWLARGQERYGIFCSPCHGIDGYGNGMIAVRADQVAAGSWVQPTSMHAGGAAGPVNMPVGQLYHTVTNGARTMAGYKSQIPDIRDRWAIVAYIRALQRSQDTN